MLISQIIRPDGSLAVVARDGSESAIVKGAASTYALAQEAIATGRSLADVIGAHGLGAAVDLVDLAAKGRLTLPVTHPDVLATAIAFVQGLGPPQRSGARVCGDIHSQPRRRTLDRRPAGGHPHAAA